MEFVYVVPRSRVFPDHYPQGFVPFGEDASALAAGAAFSRRAFEAAVREHGFFVERERAERTPEWKQVIPYTVVLARPSRASDEEAASAERSVLLLKRLKQGGEARLHDKLSIGVGGHINPEDLQFAESAASPSTPPTTSSATSGTDPVAAGCARELDEELHLTEGYALHPVGIINDDANSVGAVHVGFVQVLTTDGPVAVREQDVLEGELVPPGELTSLVAQGANFESWSSMLVERWSEILERVPARTSVAASAS